VARRYNFDILFSSVSYFSFLQNGGLLFISFFVHFSFRRLVFGVQSKMLAFCALVLSAMDIE
jgi:hypothetical protein